MSVKYLYYTESTATGGALSAAYAVTALDQVLAMFGGERMAIHPKDADYESSAGESFSTLESAQAAYPLHQWLYLDAVSDAYLDALDPPADNVVYAVGHDLTGYGGEELNGKTYKLRTLRTEPFQGHAMIMLSVSAIDRWTRMRA